MGIFDSFKPKWKHSDAEVRADAVRRMGDAREEVLLQIAREDEDVRVRRIALKRLRDPQSIAEVAAKDPDHALREAAIEQLLATATAASDEPRSLAAIERLMDEKSLAEAAKRAQLESVRRAAMARVTDPKSLADVARHGNDPVDRRSATERLVEPHVLRDIALADPVREVCLAAIERIHEVESLEEIARSARCKWGRTAARAKAEGLRPAAPLPSAAEPSAAERRRTRRVQIGRALRAAALSPHIDAVVAEVEASRRDWDALGTEDMDNDALREYETGLQGLEARRLELEKHQVETEAREAARVESERVAAEERARLATESRSSHATADAVAVTVGPEGAASGSEGTATAEARTPRAEKPPKRERTPAELAKAVERAEAACARLERVSPESERKAVEQALKEAQGAFPKGDRLPPEQRGELRARFDQARDRVQARLQELREADEWVRWSNVPKLEDLCGRVEALAEVTDLAAVAKELKAAQTEWKTLPAPRDKSEELWARFKKASDAAYERCREHFATLDKERAENLQKKEELCLRAEALAESTDWKGTSEALKKLQEDWKTVGPPPKERAQVVWKRFRAACDRFFERLKAHHAEVDVVRGENLGKQEELVKQAEALAESTDWKATADRIKALQVEWKGIGVAPPAASRAAWNRFRAACDRFFERQKEHFAKLDEERAQNLVKKEELAAKAEEAQGKLTRIEVSAQIREWMAAWKLIGPAPREKSDAIWERFRTACDKVRETATGPAPAEGTDSMGALGFRDPSPRPDGPRRDGPRRDGPRPDGPRRDGPRRDGPPRSAGETGADGRRTEPKRFEPKRFEPRGGGGRDRDGGGRREGPGREGGGRREGPRRDGGGREGGRDEAFTQRSFKSSGEFGNRLPLEDFARILQARSAPPAAEAAEAAPVATTEAIVVRPAEALAVRPTEAVTLLPATESTSAIVAAAAAPAPHPEPEAAPEAGAEKQAGRSLPTPPEPATGDAPEQS